MDEGVRLETPKEVMKAFLQGFYLINSNYGADRKGDMYLYLSESGYICEEDGAGAKGDRVPIVMRNDEWWEILK